jgi:beta-N-acetylhexosaminidase
VTPRRIILLCSAVAAVAVVLILAIGDTHKVKALHEGGSSFGASAPVADAKHRTGLLDALASVPSDGANRRAATARSRAARAARSPARAHLPASMARSAARLFLVGFGGPTATPAILQPLARHEWGGVVLEPGNGVSPQQVAGLVGQIRGAALAVGHKAPLIAASQLGGRLDAVPVQSLPQSAVRSAAGARAAALGAAKALHPLGIRMVLAPDADIGVAGGPWDGIAFSGDPEGVTQMTAAAVTGWKQGEIAPAPGHFPGEGAASGDPAQTSATVGLSLTELQQRDLKPFAAIVKHAPAIQLSSATYVAYDGVTPATLLSGVVKLLRTDMGFGGVIVSGDLSAAALAGNRRVADLAVQALKAGADLVWIPGSATDQDAAWRAVVRALRTGELPAARVADALRRVRRLRTAYGVR